MPGLSQRVATLKASSTVAFAARAKELARQVGALSINIEEAALIYRWITEPGARIVSASQPLTLPAHGAARRLDWSRLAREARR